MNIKEKMTMGKAKKILRGFLAKDCYYDTPLYYAIPYILEYINELQQEIQRKDNIIIEVKDIINRMIYMGYCAKTGKGTTATNFMAVGEQSEFGTRAKYILDKIKELEEK